MSDVSIEKKVSDLKTTGGQNDSSSSGFVNSAYAIDDTITSTSHSGNSGYVSYPSNPPAYEAMGSEVNKKPPNGMEIIEVNAAEKDMDEKILNVLRDVARKCTNANPDKRPTAKEVLKMLEEVAPAEMLEEKFDISDDELEEDQWDKPAIKKGFSKKRM